jgi:hypothetical protein
VSSLRDSLLELAGTYASSGAITAELKTNLGPAVTIYAGGEDTGLLDALGIKAAVVVRRDGKVIASTGDPPATEPLVAVALAVALAIAAALLVMAVRKL